MLSLKEALFRIQATEYREYLLEGLSRSEPILTRDENGLVDNYFMYACNEQKTEISKPLVVFGIYSDLKRGAYSTQETPFEDKIYTCGDVLTGEEAFSSYRKYEELYPRIREIAFSACTEEEKELVREYLVRLKSISGSVLWGFYEELFPSFFEWAERL